MKKLFLFLGAILLSTCLWAKQGGTLTSTPSPINPSENAVINYDGTGTNFANWEPSCYVHAWLVAAEGQEFSKSYTTEWTTCNGDEEYAKLDDKVKMTYSGTKGKYSITMNIKSFFGVEDADLPKIAKLGIIVKSQWNKEDENQNVTEDLFVNVGEPQPTIYYVTGNAALCGEKAWDAQAFKMEDGSYTFKSMKAGEYELRVTDGTWDHSWGYSALSKTVATEGLYKGKNDDGTENDNIGFTVYKPNDVTITLTEGHIVTVTGDFKAPVITYKDSVYYVAGNFTNWAAEMKALPYEVEFPADSALEFKQVMTRTILSDGDSIGKDTTWYGQENEGFYMTRENSAWTLDGGYNVLAVTDIAGKYVFSRNDKGEFVITWPKEPVITYKDSVYYVAGNFTSWAAEMKALPYEVELPADSVLEFKQIMLRTILSDGDSIGKDTTWYGQENEGFYMTRENSAWTLDGGYNVLAVTDIAGKYVFSRNDKGEFVITWPKEPVITYKDSVYYVAGNFTSWAAEMKALPYEVELPADSVLEFKQIMLRTILSDGDSIGKDTTWYGQANEGSKMTRESSAWTLDGGYNVLAVTDIAGKYVFSRNDKGEFVITWPKEPVITYKDSVYYVAGNFTNWAAEMKALPYEVELPADSVLEFKQIMLRTILSDGDSIGQDTTWYGQENEGFYMTRENSAWTLDGGYNVLAVTDIAGKYVFSRNDKGEFVITWPKEPVITYKDSVYYVAGNFTKWAAEMKALPYEVELPADSALEFKQVMLRTVLSDGDSIGKDTTWYGQANEGAYMTRENSAWTLDGGYNVLAVTDIAGKYVFSMNEKGEFVITWPKEPVITYKDTVYYVAGNFTNWAAEMKALPYEVELPADSVLEFKQIMLRTILSDGDSIGKDTTWYGQESSGFYMTRGNSEWILDGGHNVLAKTDIAGKYVFSRNDKGEFVITWPEIPVKYYAKNNWNGAAADDWSWLEMSATDRENIYMLDSVVFGGTGVNINTKEDDTDALWFAADAITVLDGLDGLPGPIPPEPRKRDTIPYAPARMVAPLEAPQLLAGDTIKLFFNAADSTLSAAIVGRPEQPEPAKTFDLTIVQDTLWTKDGGKVAAWIWGEELAGEWTAWATNVNDTLTLKVNEKADSIILVRCAPEAEVPTWEPWNRIDAGEIEDCHLLIITNWNEGVWCERPEPCEGEFGILVNETYIPAALNEERQDVVEYMLLDVALNAGDLVQIYDKCNEVAWIITEYMPDSYQFHVTENKYIIQDGEEDTYSFYFQLGPDKLYVLKGQSPTGMNEIESNATIQKIVRDGHLYIMVNEQVYNVQGIRVQ